MPEGQRLQRISRTAKDPVKLHRAMVVLASAQGWPVPDIADLAQTSQRYVRGVIHEFNERGFDALDPKWSGGAPRKINNRTRTRIRIVASCRPRDLGQPFGDLVVGETTRLPDRNQDRDFDQPGDHPGHPRQAGISWQATKTWKGSNAPDFVAKMRRVLDLYDHAPTGERLTDTGDAR